MINVDKLNFENMDVYYPLNQKKKIIKEVSTRYFLGDLLDLGCGEKPYKKLILDSTHLNSYTGVDIENPIYQKDIVPDLFWDGYKIPVNDGQFNSAILIEVLEHIPDPQNTLNELYRVMKNDGYLLITVPFLWTLHDVPNDENRYTPFALKRMLKKSGFTIEILESITNWHGSMALMLALYIKRGLPKKIKKVAAFLLLPIIKYLMKKDQNQKKTNFTEGQMIGGLWCLAKKQIND